MSLKPLTHDASLARPRHQIEAEIARFLELLFAPGDVFEIRAPECRDHAGSRFEYVVSGYYADAELAASAVADLETRCSPVAIYVTLNPVDTALLARAANRLKATPKATTGDRDVLRRRWMLVDLDPVRPPGVSATEAEFRAAHDKALAVMDILIAEGWPAPLLGLSGNGAHLLFRIDLPADDNGLLRRVLAGLAQRFDDDAVKVDRAVHNASRLTKVMGTMSRKGDEVRGVAGVEDRVHRRAELLRIPDEIIAVSPELLERVALPIAPATTQWHRATGQVGRTPEEVRRWLVDHGVAVKGERRLEGCTMLLLERCPVIPEIESTGSSDIAVLVSDSGRLAYCNLHSRGQHLKWKDLRAAIDPKRRDRRRRSKGCPSGIAETDKAAPSDGASDHDDEEEQCIPLGQRDPETGRLVLSPRSTLPTAEAFVWQLHAHPEGRMLLSYAGTVMVWRGNRFVEIEEESLRQQLQPWLHEALRYQYNKKLGELELVNFESNPGTIKAAVESIRVYAHLPVSVTPPAWLDNRADPPDPRNLLPFPSGTLDLATGKTLLPTPALFNINAIDFDYVPNPAVPERWIKFLEQLWGDDIESVELLQEFIGYCLVADTSQHKMLLMVGPKRSGKGTIGRVMARLVGAGNVVGPTTSSLAGPFGLQPLIGKSLAIVSDARFSGENVGVVVERLLCISGEDTLTVDRKFLGSLTMKLPTRFVLLTNELPRMNDASGALAGRFVILRLTNSFYGQENTRLTEELVEELPGILVWAIEGLKRLRARGHFVQPSAVSDAVQQMEDLASPVMAFVRDCCEVGVGYRAWVDDMYDAWKRWCESDGRHTVSSKQLFGRDLAAAVPGVICRRHSAQGRFYDGICLRAEGTT